MFSYIQTYFEDKSEKDWIWKGKNELKNNSNDPGLIQTVTERNGEKKYLINILLHCLIKKY